MVGGQEVALYFHHWLSPWRAGERHNTLNYADLTQTKIQSIASVLSCPECVFFPQFVCSLVLWGPWSSRVHPHHGTGVETGNTSVPWRHLGPSVPPVSRKGMGDQRPGPVSKIISKGLEARSVLCRGL